MNKILVITLIILISGCATSPTSLNNIHLIPKDAVLDSSYTKYSSAKPQLIIVRDRGFTGAACSIRLFINGTPTADLDTSEKITLYPEIGEYILSIRYNGICGDGQLNETVVNLRKGDSKKYRIAIGLNSGIQILRTAF